MSLWSPDDESGVDPTSLPPLSGEANTHVSFGTTAGRADWNSVSGAGAFLRQNAATDAHQRRSLFAPSAPLMRVAMLHNVLEDTSGDEINEKRTEGGEAGRDENDAAVAVPFSTRPAVPARTDGGFGRSTAPVNSVAGALLRAALPPSGSPVQSSLPANTLARKPLRRPMSTSAEEGAPATEPGVSPETNSFVHATQSLLDELDEELLSRDFAPQDRVVEIVVAGDGIGEASAVQIEERLKPYRDLAHDIDGRLMGYIESHHEIPVVVSDFAEMILAISGNEDTLGGLKRQLVAAAASLNTHADQLRVLRIRAAKSLLMAESLRCMRDALATKAKVKELLHTRHYLGAAELIMEHRARLHAEPLKGIRAMQGLRDHVDSTLATMHTSITEDLIDCVFRHARLFGADASLRDFLADEEIDPVGDARGSPNARAVVESLQRLAMPGVAPAVPPAERDAAAERSDGAPRRRAAKEVADGVEGLRDDPDDSTLTEHYLTFIPLCVKSLVALGQLDRLHETFFSRTARGIGRCITQFLRLYDKSRREAQSKAGLMETDTDAAVRAIRVHAVDLVSETVSLEEAIAMVQRRELESMLTALLAELEKVLRNVFYLRTVVLVASFPFLSAVVSRPEGFVPEETVHEWCLHDVPLPPPPRLGVLMEATTRALDERWRGPPPRAAGDEAAAWGHLRERLTADHVLERLGTPPAGAAGRVRDLHHYVSEVSVELRARPPGIPAEALHHVGQAWITEWTRRVREEDLLPAVTALLLAWDVRRVRSQVHYYMAFLYRKLCDARVGEEEGGGGPDAPPPAGWYGRPPVKSGESPGEDAGGLDRLLATYHTAAVLRLVEEAGRVRYSLVGAVRRARVEAAGRRPAEETLAETLAGGTTRPLLIRSTALRRWFVFTAMNGPTCYAAARHWDGRWAARLWGTPGGAGEAPEDPEAAAGFFRGLFRTTYTPALYAFVAQELRRRCREEGAPEETAEEPSSPSRPSARVRGAAAAAAAWPTVTRPETPFPLLAGVHYVGLVLEKMRVVRRGLAGALADDVEQSTAGALLTELAVLLKHRLQRLGRGTIQYRLLNRGFEEAFAGVPRAAWAGLGDEAHPWDAYRAIDRDLFLYYQYNNAQRTSGHQYHADNAAALEALTALEQDKGNLDERIGLLPARDLGLAEDGAVVALATLCSSAEWLAGVVRRHLDATDGEGGAGRVEGPRTTPRLAGHLTLLETLSQAALLYLSVEARFAAFQFIPQLRDESFNIAATSCSADTFVQAYARRISNLYTLLRGHLDTKKIKRTCLTIGKPVSELILLELAQLRDKAISEAGLQRLRTDLLVIQTTLQLILPMDVDVRDAVSLYFSRLATFLRYVRNQDVVNELISSGDYRLFTSHEVNVLIRLVFRQFSGANDDRLARKHITLYREKVAAIQTVREDRGGQVGRNRMGRAPLPLVPTSVRTAHGPETTTSEDTEELPSTQLESAPEDGVASSPDSVTTSSLQMKKPIARLLPFDLDVEDEGTRE